MKSGLPQQCRATTLEEAKAKSTDVYERISSQIANQLEGGARPPVECRVRFGADHASRAVGRSRRPNTPRTCSIGRKPAKLIPRRCRYLACEIISDSRTKSERRSKSNKPLSTDLSRLDLHEMRPHDFTKPRFYWRAAVDEDGTICSLWHYDAVVDHAHRSANCDRLRCSRCESCASDAFRCLYSTTRSDNWVRDAGSEATINSSKEPRNFPARPIARIGCCEPRI